MISTTAFHGPLTLARCTFRGTMTPSTPDFHVTIVDATDVDGNEVVPKPVVIVVPE